MVHDKCSIKQIVGVACMGNRITRRGRRPQAIPQALGEIVESLNLSNSIGTTGMNNGESNDETNDVPVPLENDPDLTAILSFLLRR